MTRNLIAVLLIVGANSAHAENVSGQNATEFENCSEKNIAAIKSAENMTMQFVSDWRATLSERFGIEDSPVGDFMGETSFEPKSKPEMAFEVLGCIKERMAQGLVYHCTDSRGTYAGRTFPLFGRTVDLDRFFALGAYDLKGLAGVLIHEASHKCGATDAAYFLQDGTKPHDTAVSGWAHIAATYEYWAVRGFCIPLVDC